MANLLTVSRITCKILIVLALTVAITMPVHPQTGAAGEKLPHRLAVRNQSRYTTASAST
jgi:hypothetical protein